ncbi:MAG: ATP-binding protein, partial [Candidatus Dormibacteraeota bacterium]|nr:ATP-binding protein [Candidatus Dormibacteraeota bacterium]
MRGGGETVIVDAPPEFRGPSVQVAGLYPFSAGGTLPMVGVPLGPHLDGRGVVCADPVSWFVSHLINNPSAFVLARPGLGKSSLVARILTLLVPKGILPLVLSDVKGEYVILIRDCLHGQVIAPGRGSEFVNPLDRGPLSDQLSRLPAAVRAEAEGDIEARRLNVMVGLCELALLRPLQAHERSVLAMAPRLWEEGHPGQVPVIPDLLELVRARPERLASVVNDRGSAKRYFTRLEGLVDALIALSGDGEFGDVFAHHTTSPMAMHRPVVFDLSAV